MVFIKVNKQSPFLRYMMEADDNEEETIPANRKLIKLKASDGRRTSYTKDAEITLDDDSIEDTGDEGADEPVIDDTNYTDTDEDMNDSEFDDVGDDTGDEGADEPVIDDTNYTDDTGDSTENDNSGDDANTDGGSGDDGTNNNNNSSANKDEQMRKYVLYRKFMQLDKLLEHYSDVLNNSMSDEININKKYKRIANNLKKLNELLSEYMIIKFQTASYIQSMLFYQRVITSIDINLNVLGDIKKELIKTGIK